MDEEHHHDQVLFDHHAIMKKVNDALTGIMIINMFSLDDQHLIGGKFEIISAEDKKMGELFTDTAGDHPIAVEPGV